MIGKVPGELLEAFVLSRTGVADPRVLQGPAYGEDTAAIRLDRESDGDADGDGDDGADRDVLVINTDPISLAVERIGTLGVHVACNDVAASGATPAWLTTAIFLPDDDADTLDEITAQLDEAARRLEVAIVGGHAEYAPAQAQPLLVLTCLGLTDRYVPTSGARPGDRLLVTKGAGIEGTAILATDFADELRDDVPPEVLQRGAAFFEDVGLIEEASIVAPHAHAMHDPTEGGLVDGLIELAVASGVALEVDRAAIPVREETVQLCRAAGVDPLRIFGSGALVAAIPPEAADEVSAGLDDVGIEHAYVGTVRDGPDGTLLLGEETFTEPVRDDMYALWE